MKIDWFRAQQYQICPRARYIQFHKDGTGIERRRLSLTQFVSNTIRHCLGEILAGHSPSAAAEWANRSVIGNARTRGFVDQVDYPTTLALGKKVSEIVSYLNLEMFGEYKILEANRQRSFELSDGVDFVSTSVALMKNGAEKVVIYFPYVVSEWDSRRMARAHRNFQLLSEVATYRANNVDVDGVIVQPIAYKKSSPAWKEPFFVPYDAQLVRDWMEQVSAQEHGMEAAVLMAKAPESGDRLAARMLNKYFPQRRHACEIPYPCPFREVCWSTPDVHDPKLKDDPNYMLRVLEPWETE